jgi:hypothetical protein
MSLSLNLETPMQGPITQQKQDGHAYILVVLTIKSKLFHCH